VLYEALQPTATWVTSVESLCDIVSKLAYLTLLYMWEVDKIASVKKVPRCCVCPRGGLQLGDKAVLLPDGGKAARTTRQGGEQAIVR